MDLANSPHVLFFRPVIERLLELGHEVAVTSREFAQTVALCRRFGLAHEVIGAHGGANRLAKIANIAGRVWALAHWARRRGPFDLAVSHNSYAQCLAARILGVMTVTLMDYEHTPANHVAFRAAHRVIVPAVFPDDALRRFGARPGKCRRYDGLKEEVYLLGRSGANASPDGRRDIERAIGTAVADSVLVTVRPPATMAVYHRFKNQHFDALLDYLEGHGDVVVLLLPRTPRQQASLEARHLRNVRFPAQALDGRAVIEYSDLVVGAGGTMNREAAVLGTPAYTIFAGRMGAVDRWLVEQGRMVDLAGPLGRGTPPEEVFSLIRLEKKPVRYARTDSRVLDEVVELILGAAHARG